MSLPILECLIAEARGLVNDHPCVREHLWVVEGGRACSRCDESQPVYRCARCGEYDYGYPGGPAWQECERSIDCRVARMAQRKEDER